MQEAPVANHTRDSLLRTSFFRMQFARLAKVKCLTMEAGGLERFERDGGWEAATSVSGQGRIICTTRCFKRRLKCLT